MHDAARHAVLADPTRRALLDALRDAPGPRGVRDLAGVVGLHRNSVREQLQQLERAGLVRVTRSEPSGRGRPCLRYALAPEPEEPYRVLAGVLADQLAILPDPSDAWAAAGERWGRGAASAVVEQADLDPADALIGLLADAGFAPEPAAPGDDEVNLRACPFLPIEHRHLPVVCGIHLGFIRGALRELGSTRDATSIEPLVRPDLCVARLGRMPSA
jgi:predicted ArsR family transcriptional regulator